jgi:hypothetical protein
MPTYPGDIQDKLDALQALTGADRKPAELCAIYWPSPTGTKIYSSAMYTEHLWWPDLAAAIETYFGDPIPITLTLIPDGTPFIDLPRAASISDDSINLTFSDLDDEFSGLLMAYGEGIRTEVFCYWPAVDLLLSMWRGMLHQPKEMNREQVKITATSGWRAPQMLVPKRPFATSCPHIFGAFYATQAAIDQAKGCPYNAHLTELERGGAPLIGVPGFTDCPRRVKADCSERLTEPDTATPTEQFWPGFETRADPIPNNQTKGPNLLAKAIGNESALSDPIRVIAGERYVKALYLLAFRNETDTNHPEDGFGAALFAVSEGVNQAMWEFRINDQIVGTEHFQLRLGELGQEPTDWSPDVNSYSGTAHCYGRIQGDFGDATASDYSGSIRVLGAKDVRVYSDPNTFIEGYTTNRAWWLLHVLAHLRWGYGQDYPRFDIQSFIDAAAWFDEYVTLTDSNGNTFTGVRSTFNAEVTARAIQQQVKDLCTAGRLGIPFEFEGKDVVVPLRAEDLGDINIPSFTDEGPNRNIVYDGAKSSLSWVPISDEEMINQWVVNFDDASNSGVDTQLIFSDQPQQLRAGRAWGDRSKRVINKSQAGYGINSAQEAARFGNSLLYLGPLDSGGILNPFSVKFTTWYSEAFNVQNYKLIRVINTKLQSRMTAYFTARGLTPYPGADFTYFRVMKYTRKGDLRVEIEAQQYATLEESPAVQVDGYIYLGNFFPPWVTRLQKDFSSFETIQFTNDEDNFGAMTSDDDYVYIVSGHPSEITRFSKADWGAFESMQVGSVSAETTDPSPNHGELAIVVDDNYIFVGFNAVGSSDTISRIHRVHKSNFSTNDVLEIPGVTDGCFSIAQDDSHIYALTAGNFSPSTNDKVWKINKSAFAIEGSAIDLGGRNTAANAQALCADNTTVYLSFGFDLIKIDTASWTSTSTAIGIFCRCLISDGAFLWGGRSGVHYVTKFNKSDLSVVGNIDLTGAPVSRLGQDDGFVYALQSESTPEAEVTKIDKSNLSFVDWREEINPDDPLIYSMVVDGGAVSPGTFSTPRDLTAVVNSTTGVVHFHWSPPLLHPELVTGYTLYESDGVTVAMPTALVYDFELTLAPGIYTYKLNATDGATVSAFISVTFTVDAPPITGSELFVIDDLTLEDVFDDLTLEQVTV